MKRLIFTVIFFSLSLFGDSFVSLHEDMIKNLLSNTDFLNMKEVPLQSTSFYRKYPHAKSSTGDKNGVPYFPQGWMQFKYYVPAGTVGSVVMGTIPNSCFRVHLSFQGPINHHDPFAPRSADFMFNFDKVNSALLNHSTIEFFTTQGTMNYSVKNNSNIGGWVYITMVEDSIFPPSAPYGYTSSGTIDFTVRYKIIDKNRFLNWLFNTPLISENGNPSAINPYVHVVDIPAPNQIAEYDIPVDTGNFFYNGPNPFDSGFSSENIESPKVECKSNEIYKDGKCIVQSDITPQTNSNTTSSAIGAGGTNTNTSNADRTVTCYDGYRYNPNSGMCESIGSTSSTQASGSSSSKPIVKPTVTTNTDYTNNDRSISCYDGYRYNPSKGLCEEVEGGVSEVSSSSSYGKSSSGTDAYDVSCYEGYYYDTKAGLCKKNKDQEKNIADIIKKLEHRILGVDGYFAYYGPETPYEPFSWVYATADGSLVAKLEGMDKKSGSLKWLHLFSLKQKLFDKVEIKEGKIIFGNAVNPLE